MGRGASDSDMPETSPRRPDVDLDGREVNITLEDGSVGRVLGYVLRDSEGKLRIVARSSEDLELDEVRALIESGDTGSA